MSATRFLPPLAVLLFLTGCGALKPGFETPSVTVSSFRAVPSDGMLPAFEIGLRVTNPNRQALKLAGMSYAISLDGRELIKGVASDLPTISAYGQGDVTVTAAADLLAGARVLTELMRANRNSVSYELEAKLDTGLLGLPIRVRDSGEISLTPGR